MGKADLKYSNGLKFDKCLAKTCDGMITRVQMKKASCGVIDGNVGEGKTTLAVEMAQYIEEQHGCKFEIEQQVGMGGRDFAKALNYAVENKKHVVVYDEAGDFNTRASLTFFNQTINRIFETFRATRVIVILCLPSFADVDTSLMKKGVLRFLVHCHSRTMTYGRYNGYDLSRMWYIKKNFTRVTIPADAFKITSPNFYGMFKDLDPEDSKTLETFSLKGKREIIKQTMLKQNGLISAKEISEKSGYHIKSVRDWLKEKKAPATKDGRNKYYDKVNLELFVASRSVKAKDFN